MPFAAQDLPRHEILRPLFDPVSELLKAGHRFGKETPKLGMIDLGQRMDVDLDFLKRPAKVFAFPTRIVAIDGQMLQLVERLEADAGDEVVAFERSPSHAEFELKDPLFERDGVKEPTVGFLLGADLDHAAGIPIGLAKLAQFLNSIDDAGEKLAVPATEFAIAADVVFRVPAAAVRFPGHLGRLPDFVNLDVLLAPRFCRDKIVRPPLDMWTGGENRRQGLGGMGAEIRGGCGITAGQFGALLRCSPVRKRTG